MGTNPSTSRIVCMFGFCAHLSRFTGPGRVLLVLTVVLTTCWKEDCFLNRGKSRRQNSLSVKEMSKLCPRLATSGSFTQEVSAGPGHLRVRAASARRWGQSETMSMCFISGTLSLKFDQMGGFPANFPLETGGLPTPNKDTPACRDSQKYNWSLFLVRPFRG